MGETRSQQRRIPLSPSELERWQEAARGEGQPLTEFVREAVEQRIARAERLASSSAPALDEFLEQYGPRPTNP